ncbi:MAG: hypothetical protein ACRD2B_06925 [Terriglobia bacterium]
MSSKSLRWIKYFVAVIGGNVIYLCLSPVLPPRARHHHLVDWGTFVDLWICFFVYGLVELTVFIFRGSKPPRR